MPSPEANFSHNAQGYLVKCVEGCQREQRTGDAPLRNGWPKCCGYTMRLIDTQGFIRAVDREVGEVFR